MQQSTTRVTATSAIVLLKDGIDDTIFLGKYTGFLCYQLIVTAQEHPPPPYGGGRGGSGWVGGWVSLGGWVGCLVLRQPHRDPPPPRALLSKGLARTASTTHVLSGPSAQHVYVCWGVGESWKWLRGHALWAAG